MSVSHLTIDVTDQQQALNETAELKALLRARLSEAERGELDERSFEEIAQEAVRTDGPT